MANAFYSQIGTAVGNAAGQAAGKAAADAAMQNVYGQMSSGGGAPPAYAPVGGQPGQGGTGPGGEEEMAWWMRWLIKGGVTVAGSLAFICGLMTAISISPICIVSGVFMMLGAIVVVGLEAPICCAWVPFLERVQTIAQDRPKWQKAAFYAILGVIPLCLCQSFATIFGFILFFACAALYGVLAIGKKAPRDLMLSRAGGGQIDQANLVQGP